MFLFALSVVLLLFIVLVAQPESWPGKFASFLREHNVHNG